MLQATGAKRGFTMVELMVVLAILGILSAIALPVYQSYVVRSKISEPLAQLGKAKTLLAGYVAAKRRYPRQAELSALDLRVKNSEVVHSLDWAPNPLVDGESVYIVAKVYASVVDGGSPDPDNLLAFQLSGSTNNGSSMRWTCLPGAGPGRNDPLPGEYLPPSCKG